MEEFDRVLGVVELRRAEDAQLPMSVEEIERMIEERRIARQRHDFATADRIRRELVERGILLEDSASGTRWKKK
jgi:cysteinyl-tRNA synthetase